MKRSLERSLRDGGLRPIRVKTRSKRVPNSVPCLRRALSFLPASIRDETEQERERERNDNGRAVNKRTEREKEKESRGRLGIR